MKFKNFCYEKLTMKFINWAIPLGLFGLALAVRIPWLWEIPRYIDELREVNLGYQIYLGKEFPLHNVALEIGAVHNYILAGIFSFFGPNPYWPRLYVAITSALTVVLVYYLGKRLFNRTAGAIAAGLLLTNGMHILATHMGWANGTTPFFFVLAVFGTILAEEKKSWRWLTGAGFLWALALQTHSSVIVFLLVAVIYVLSPSFRKSTGFRTADYFKAAGAFTLGYANMIIFNLTSRFESIRWLSAKHYTLEANPGIVTFGNNAYQMLIELLRAISSVYSNHEHLWEYLTHPEFILGLLLLGIGVIWAITGASSRGPKLLVGMIAGGFLVIPWINNRYSFFLVTRYIMPVIICAILLVGAALAYLLEKLWVKVGNSQKIRGAAGAPVVKAPWLQASLITKAILVIILAVQLIPYYQYCQRLNNTDLSNRISWEALHRVKEIGRPEKTVVLIDRSLTGKDAPLPLLFKMSKIKYITLPKDIFSRSFMDLSSIFRKNHLGSGVKVVAILSTPLYNRLKVEIPVVKEIHFSRQVLINTEPEVNKREVIHITVIRRPRNLYSTNLKSHKS